MFAIGAVVWYKLPNKQWWPAKVVSVKRLEGESIRQTQRRIACLYGITPFAKNARFYFDADSLVPFDEHPEQNMTRRLLLALSEVNQYLAQRGSEKASKIGKAKQKPIAEPEGENGSLVKQIPSQAGYSVTISQTTISESVGKTYKGKQTERKGPKSESVSTEPQSEIENPLQEQTRAFLPVTNKQSEGPSAVKNNKSAVAVSFEQRKSAVNRLYRFIKKQSKNMSRNSQRSMTLQLETTVLNEASSASDYFWRIKDICRRISQQDSIPDQGSDRIEPLK